MLIPRAIGEALTMFDAFCPIFTSVRIGVYRHVSSLTPVAMLPYSASRLKKNAPTFGIGVANRDYHYLSQSEIDGAKRIYRHLPRVLA